VVGPFLDAWKAKHPSVSGHQGRYSLREILNSICLALGIGTEPKDTEGIRAKLKRLVNRQILTESQPGLFTLTEKRA
jgi:hypothetical protein